MNLGALVSPDIELSEEQREHIQGLQDEINDIWNKHGNYTVDDEAWKQMPIFMESITEEDVHKNEACAAIASIVYDEVPPEEQAENRKEHGNKAMKMAQTPGQVNPHNLARAAVHCYTDGLTADCNDRVLNSQLYANRSLGQFILQNYGHGLQDAQKAIILNPSYTKAYYRAARCAEKIRKYEIAIDLLEKGLQTIVETDKTSKAEMDTLLQQCKEGLEKGKKKDKQDSLKTRVKAAQSSSIFRGITSHGVKVSSRPEVQSEQMAALGTHQPYFDTDDVLHVPILFMYDEYNQTDFMQDVACDVSVADIVEEMMPFPWDDKGRYSSIDNLLVVYKIDDGVKMPEFYTADPSWLLMEVFRTATYTMPGFLPVLHIIPKGCDLAKEWGL